MKNYLLSLTFKHFCVLCLSLLLLYSCNNDDDINTDNPIELGALVTLENTFQSPNNTRGNEWSIDQVLGQPAGYFTQSNLVGTGTEFSMFLFGLYSIDVGQDYISFKFEALDDNPYYENEYGVYGNGTTSRYYFTFSEPHKVAAYSSTNSSVRLSIPDEYTLVVEIGEGYNFSPGNSFSVYLNQ